MVVVTCLIGFWAPQQQQHFDSTDNLGDYRLVLTYMGFNSLVPSLYAVTNVDVLNSQPKIFWVY